MFYDNKDIYIAKLHHVLKIKISLKRGGLKLACSTEYVHARFSKSLIISSNHYVS